MITVDLTRLDLRGPSRILDIGCGSGRHTAVAYGLDDTLAVGADPRLADLKQARERLAFHAGLGTAGRGSRWGLCGATIEALPFSDHCFDVVICSEVLEHLHDQRGALHEMRRVLRPGGHLIVSVPRRWPETLCWLLSKAYRTAPGGHVRIVHVGRLMSEVRSLGLRHYRTHHAHSLHAPYWWLKCLIGLDRDQLLPIQLYHRLLTWDMMQRPRLTRCLDRLFNPLLGKSVVLYFTKPKGGKRIRMSPGAAAHPGIGSCAARQTALTPVLPGRPGRAPDRRRPGS